MSKTRKQRGMKPDRLKCTQIFPLSDEEARLQAALIAQMFKDWDRAVEYERTRPRKPWEKQ